MTLPKCTPKLRKNYGTVHFWAEAGGEFDSVTVSRSLVIWDASVSVKEIAEKTAQLKITKFPTRINMGELGDPYHRNYVLQPPAEEINC